MSSSQRAFEEDSIWIAPFYCYFQVWGIPSATAQDGASLADAITAVTANNTCPGMDLRESLQIIFYW